MKPIDKEFRDDIYSKYPHITYIKTDGTLGIHSPRSPEETLQLIGLTLELIRRIDKHITNLLEMQQNAE